MLFHKKMYARQVCNFIIIIQQPYSNESNERLLAALNFETALDVHDRQQTLRLKRGGHTIGILREWMTTNGEAPATHYEVL